MNKDQEFGLRLNDFGDVSTREPDSLGLTLTIPNTIVYHRGVKARGMQMMDITVEGDDGLICFYGPNKAIELIFVIDELRAIMRLFDTGSSSVPQDDSER